MQFIRSNIMIDYYTAWHGLFATWAYLIFFRIKQSQRFAYICMLCLAILWEIIEYIWLFNYSSFERWKINTFWDIVVAVFVGGIMCILTKNLIKRKV